MKSGLGRKARFIAAIVRYEPIRRILIGLKMNTDTTAEQVSTLDTEFGVDTGGYLPPYYLNSGKVADQTNRAFSSVTPEVFHPILNAILHTDQKHFVDIGAGKGAAMIIAAEHPFKTITGIELSRYLCEIAWKNLKLIEQSRLKGRQMQLIEGDASDPELPDGPVVVGFFNSFYGAPLDRLLAKLAQHAKVHEVLFVYGNPIEWEVLDAHPAFDRWLAYPFVADDMGEKCCIVVWRSGPELHPPVEPTIVYSPPSSRIVVHGALSYISDSISG